MNERVHRYLDGELRQEALTSEELQEIAACEDLVRETRESYQSIKVPDLTARVMSRLPAAPASHGVLNGFIQNALEWIWTPRAIRLRPVYGMLAVAAVCLIFVLTKSTNRDADHANGKVFVQFRLDASKASEVRLAEYGRLWFRWSLESTITPSSLTAESGLPIQQRPPLMTASAV